MDTDPQRDRHVRRDRRRRNGLRPAGATGCAPRRRGRPTAAPSSPAHRRGRENGTRTSWWPAGGPIRRRKPKRSTPSGRRRPSAPSDPGREEPGEQVEELGVVPVQVLQVLGLDPGERIGTREEEVERAHVQRRTALPQDDLGQVEPQERHRPPDVQEDLGRPRVGERQHGRPQVAGRHRGQPAREPQLCAHGTSQRHRRVVGDHHQGGQVGGGAAAAAPARSPSAGTATSTWSASEIAWASTRLLSTPGAQTVAPARARPCVPAPPARGGGRRGRDGAAPAPGGSGRSPCALIG